MPASPAALRPRHLPRAGLVITVGLVVACCRAPSPAEPAPAPIVADPARDTDAPTSATSSAPADAALEPAAFIEAVARDIERLGRDYPQLRRFSAARHCDPARLVIEYGYHTHAPTGRGGWTAGVPNPDPDGVWLYIDLHDPGSTAQIHTQPVVMPRRYGDQRVMVLLLDGEETRPLGAALSQVLERNGVEAGTP